jgi:hypothetical protein
MNGSNLTPQSLFEAFDRAQADISVGINALEEFRAVKNQSAFLEPTIQFLNSEERDRVKSWGTNILEIIGGDQAYEALMALFDKKDTKVIKRTYLHTRFFALRGIVNLSETEERRAKLEAMLRKIWPDEDEDYLVRAEAAVLLARQGQSGPRDWVVDMLSRYGEFWPILRTLRALREFPLADMADEVILIIRNSQYLDHQYDAIRVLGAYPGDIRVIRALGDVVLTDRNEYLRLIAVLTIGRLGDRQSQEDLVHALQDGNAEIRLQASNSLLKCLPSEEAVAIVIQRALRPGIGDLTLAHYVEALRQMDPDRTISTNLLSNELGGEDRKRAEAAERVLIDLGGWAAVQRLSQRRRTLDSLDKLLADSEQVVRSTFEGTIRQARLNFYFAMIINGLIVLVGLVLVGVAISHLIQQPDKLEACLIPGGTGILGVLINLGFNNPRNNARDDLATLMNINVIFLGFLRRLNQIDATFKHAYIESRDFGTTQMHETVQEIEEAVTQALNMARSYLHGVEKTGREA